MSKNQFDAQSQILTPQNIPHGGSAWLSEHAKMLLQDIFPHHLRQKSMIMKPILALDHLFRMDIPQGICNDLPHQDQHGILTLSTEPLETILIPM
ncbi:MAG: hypothetical protein HQK66_04525 [Desulfamplus sp.]|nr:hypothetical protein [Desulfamplus sp.]